ncbi:FAD-dependent oxidoreductase [Desulfovibrio sp. TomC]|uniref:FAD-dependent oxidoreductase n=1 Tax=Desulfovibrio sp. TomC TaxID=1562888 RepID=UPI000575321A|nr:FAD-dependent oxidoreductase [Desulfovibrio sp. TomC]KHK04321.1 heterodisulfide reductase, subunit A/methylviologen reducing hydrogenase, subunit delta [Desulfovibrio sp. TomC]
MDSRQPLPILVVGSGMAGLRAALDLAAAGADVLLVEAGTRLGGSLSHVAILAQTGQPIRDQLDALTREVQEHPAITVRLGQRLESFAGQPGAFRAGLAQPGVQDREEVAVSCLILATGSVPFHPGSLDFLGHGVIPDVVTSLDLEAMLARKGGIVRPSDGQPPLSVAFMQCVGSRMLQPLDRPACCATGCAVTVRQALAMPQARRIICAIDLRAHVPGTQEALHQAESEGVALRHIRPHTLEPGPDGRGVDYRFVDEQGQECRESVDMVVLAVGVGLSVSTRAMLEASGVATGRHGFVATQPFAPVATSRPGVFVAGNLRGPGEAALAVVQGSAAACEAWTAFGPKEAQATTAPALVLGGGVAGLACGLRLAQCGIPVTLVESTDRLGGNPRKHPTIWKGQETREAVAAMAQAVLDHPGVTVLTEARLVGLSGGPGAWTGHLDTPQGPCARAFGAAVLALGGSEIRPDEYLLGRDPRVMTQLEFENWRRSHPAPDEVPRSVVFIQCVGSRQPCGYTACARLCCSQALCAAVDVKKSRPDAQVAVFYRDITAYGEAEDIYTEARRLGVLFFRYDPDAAPRVERLGTDLAVTGEDSLLGRPVRLRPDRVVLATPLAAAGVAAMAALFAVPTDALGFLSPVHPVLFPVDLPRPGLFAAGVCLGPKPLDESFAEAQAAAMRAAVFLTGRA